MIDFRGVAWLRSAGRSLAAAATVLACVAAAPASAKTADPATADEVITAAYEAARENCAAPEARRLFRRAAELGHTYGAIGHARSFDPLLCNKAQAADARQAARLYFEIAKDDGLVAVDAVRNWANLVEAKRASSAPYASRIELLSHYGRRLLAVSSGDEVLGMLQTAAVGGDAPAMATLVAAASASVADSASWSDYNKRRASCTLGKVLVARHPDGARDDEARTRLRDCPGPYDSIDLVTARIAAGRATTADRIWLADTIAHDSNLFNGHRRALMDEQVRVLSAAALSPEESRQAAQLVYAIAERRYGSGALDWPGLVAQFDEANRLDRSPSRQTRYADHLFAAARTPLRQQGQDPARDLEMSRRHDALTRAATLYGDNRETLDADQLRRLLALAWRGIGGARTDADLRRLLETLASSGDPAARNTLRLLPLRPEILDYRYSAPDFIAASDDHLCSAGRLEQAIGRQTTLYRRLSQTRGVPSVSGEVSRAALSAVAPGAAVALFHRDDLKSCVWVISPKGKVAFGEIYVPDVTLQATLDDFFAEYDIDTAGGTRAPRPRSAEGPARHDAKAARKPAARPVRPGALEALAAILFPDHMLADAAALRRLVVVPYGSVGNVPFDALPLDAAGAEFIGRFSTTIAPSLIDLFAPFAGPGLARRGEDRRREGYVRIIPGCVETPEAARARARRPAGQPREFTSALVVGDPAFADREYDLPRLSGARSEAQVVAGLFGAQPLLGPAVTHDAVAKAAPGADLIYLATHGVSFDEHGLEGFIALANGERWSAREVQSACLVRAALAVLSACQSGVGQNASAGVIGLARGFQIAGVDNVVMSLWNVDDAATRQMMLYFMARVRTGEDFAVALRDAKLHIRAQKAYANPRYWASFTLFSATQPTVVVAASGRD